MPLDRNYITWMNFEPDCSLPAATTAPRETLARVARPKPAGAGAAGAGAARCRRRWSPEARVAGAAGAGAAGAGAAGAVSRWCPEPLVPSPSRAAGCPRRWCPSRSCPSRWCPSCWCRSRSCPSQASRSRRTRSRRTRGRSDPGLDRHPSSDRGFRPPPPPPGSIAGTARPGAIATDRFRLDENELGSLLDTALPRGIVASIGQRRPCRRGPGDGDDGRQLSQAGPDGAPARAARELRDSRCCRLPLAPERRKPLEETLWGERGRGRPQRSPSTQHELRHGATGEPERLSHVCLRAPLDGHAQHGLALVLGQRGHAGQRSPHVHAALDLVLRRVAGRHRVRQLHALPVPRRAAR